MHPVKTRLCCFMHTCWLAFHVRWWLTRLPTIDVQVLLDSACTCKISDFGMSAALSKGDEASDYAANCECRFGVVG
jgi:hypothetical protein